MQVRFWGTRGSIAKPGPATVRYGGNTACVEVRAGDGTLLVLDCGTGAHGLGQALLASGQRPLRGHLFVTHTHWDHIQGFPFFVPLFIPGNEWDIYAPGGIGQRLEHTLAGQMEYTYFPVTLDQLGATIRYHDLVEGTSQVGGVRVVARYLNHPAVTLGYRLEAGGVSLVYATDHEPHQAKDAVAPQDATNAPFVHREDQRHLEFLAGADLVIHDAQYTLEEYPQKVTWGHTPAERAVDFALQAGARRLALFHHDPLRTDDALDRLVEQCRRRAGAALDVFAAAEGQVIDLPETGDVSVPAADGALSVSPASAPAQRQTILIVDDDPEIVDLLVGVLEEEDFSLLTASTGEEALRVARTKVPSLVLLDWTLPGQDGLAVCRELRADSRPEIREMPIVLVTAKSGREETREAFEAGATDYLTKPFSLPHVRSRVREWLLRAGSDTPAEPQAR